MEPTLEAKGFQEEASYGYTRGPTAGSLEEEA